jgi:hypothetical protein
VDQTFSPRAVAGIIAAKMVGVRPYDGRDVRALARGDNGPAIIARLAARPADGSNRSHVYDAGDVRLLLEAVAARHQARTGKAVRVPAPFVSAKNATVKVARATRPRSRPAAEDWVGPVTVPTDATA